MSGSAPSLLVQLPPAAAPSREQAAIICETIQQVWLAPYGLQVVPPDPSAGSSSSSAGGGGAP